MHKSRSIRRSGHPTVASAASRLRAFDRDPICEEHYGQRPAKSAASTGRTDGSTDQHCITVQKSLANREPSTDGYKRTCGGVRQGVRFTSESRHKRRKIASVPESGHRMSAYPPIAAIGRCQWARPLSWVKRPSTTSRRRPHRRGANGRDPRSMGDSRGACCRSHLASPKRRTALNGEEWCRRQESNPRPTAYKAVALPAELRRHKCCNDAATSSHGNTNLLIYRP